MCILELSHDDSMKAPRTPVYGNKIVSDTMPWVKSTPLSHGSKFDLVVFVG
jgi:hypothetical protein